MPVFSYQAADSAGRSVAGQIDAANIVEAKERLAELGLTSPRIAIAAGGPGGSPAPHPLRDGEAEEVLASLAQVAGTHFPLVDGLRSAAWEASSRRVASALRYLADEIERGKSPSEVLADSRTRLPAHVRGLVAAATRTGRLGPALDELIEHHRALRGMFWSILGSLAYPLVVLAMASVILTFLLVWVVPQFESMFVGMQLQLPVVTESLIHASQTAKWLVVGPAQWVVIVALLVGMTAMYLAATGRGGARVQRLLEMMPIIGPLWAWSGTSAFMHLLASLLEQDVPLPEALGLTAEGMSKADLRRAGKWLAAGVQSGQAMSDLVEKSNCLPATTVPVLRWGEQTGVVAEAARTLSTFFADRVHARTVWLRSASPPLVYLFVVVTVGFAITSLFLPLVSLIQGLV